MNRSHRGLAFAASILALGAGCRVQTVVNSEPQGARVTVDGYEGVTPFATGLAVTTFGNYPVRLELAGYETYEGELETEPNVGIILLSLCFPPALLVGLESARRLDNHRAAACQDIPAALRARRGLDTGVAAAAAVHGRLRNAAGDKTRETLNHGLEFGFDTWSTRAGRGARRAAARFLALDGHPHFIPRFPGRGLGAAPLTQPLLCQLR